MRIVSLALQTWKRKSLQQALIDPGHEVVPAVTPEQYHLPPHSAPNLHDRLLPKFTGLPPVLWALISCESDFGLTVQAA